MNLNEYIKQSYKRPNRKILESLGANERLIEYLMETPGNTNMQVVEAIGEGESKDDWTTIRLNAVEIDSEQHPGSYVLQGNAADFETLFGLANRDDLIIASSYNISLDGTSFNNSNDVFCLCSASSHGLAGDYALAGPLGMLPIGHNLDPYYEIDYYGLSYYMFVASADWLEIKYKTGIHYVITLSDGSSDIATWNMEPGQKWVTPEAYAQYGYKITDGINEWSFGETIIPSSDMTLTVTIDN